MAVYGFYKSFGSKHTFRLLARQGNLVQWQIGPEGEIY